MAEKHSGSDRHPGQQHRSGGSGHHASDQHRTSSHGRSEGDGHHYSLEEREYRGADGQIHHHTNRYMEQHGGERHQGRSSRSGGESGHQHGRSSGGRDSSDRR